MAKEVRQRGFSLIQLAIYAGIVIAVMGAIAGAIMAWKSYTDGIDQRGYDRGKAELQPALTKCEGEVTKHNEANAALAAESARKAKAASEALRKAAAKGKVWEDQAARLTAVLTAKRPPDKPAPEDCKAAWQEIRGQK